VLRRIFGPKRDVVTEKWRKLHNEELNDLYSTPIIIQSSKSRRMRWVVTVACIREREERCIQGVSGETCLIWSEFCMLLYISLKTFVMTGSIL
jgi:hypothetical protein